MTEPKKLTFLQAAKDFFGLKEGQTALDFAKETRQLSDADKAEITAGLEQNGYEILKAAA